MGEAIRGEAIGIVPNWMNRGLYKSFYRLGKIFSETGEFDRQILNKLAKPEKLTKSNFWFFQLLYKVINIFYWDNLLKRSGAFDKRFVKPYKSEVTF